MITPCVLISFHRARDADNPSVIRALLKAFHSTFFAPVLPGIIRALAQVVQPVMVNAILKFLQSYSDGSGTSEPVQYGWALVGAFAIVFLGLAGATSQYFYYVYLTGAYVRGALIEAIYRKTLRLSVMSAQAALSGGDASNLMRYNSCLLFEY